MAEYPVRFTRCMMDVGAKKKTPLQGRLNNGYTNTCPSENSTFDQIRKAYFPPRTLADYNYIGFWSNRSKYHLYKMMADPYWRSEVTTYTANELCPETGTTKPKVHLFCAKCDQLINLKTCSECDQSLPAVLPSLSDVEEFYLRKELARRAIELADKIAPFDHRGGQK